MTKHRFAIVREMIKNDRLGIVRVGQNIPPHERQINLRATRKKYKKLEIIPGKPKFKQKDLLWRNQF
jgi:hypothetical protein